MMLFQVLASKDMPINKEGNVEVKKGCYEGYAVIKICGNANEKKDLTTLDKTVRPMIRQGDKEIRLDLSDMTYAATGIVNLIVGWINLLNMVNGRLFIYNPTMHMQRMLDCFSIGEMANICQTDKISSVP